MYDLLTSDTLAKIEKLDRFHQGMWLFLEQSEEFLGCWKVTSLWPEFFIDFEPLIGAYRLVTPLGLEEFMAFATDHGYHVAFVDDPLNIIESYERLKLDPPVELHSELKNVRKGFLPWQIIGFNKLTNNEEQHRAGYAVWCTGSGKTALIAASILYHQSIGHEFDVALVVVKAHNKVETQRKLQYLGGIDSTVVQGTREKRTKIYQQIRDGLTDGQQIVVMNYEQFRDDTLEVKKLIWKKNVLAFWDEMPTKLSNSETQLYKGVKKVLYSSFPSKPNFTWIRHWCLSATPIENHYGDVWACLNIMWPRLLGTKKQFEETYITYKDEWGKPRGWMNIDRLEAKIQFMFHGVNTDDPEVKAMFPDIMPPDPIRLVDWNYKHRNVYDRLTGKAIDMINNFEEANILAMIQIMQMVCDAPSMIHASAANRKRFEEYLAQMELEDEEVLRYNDPIGSEIAMTLLEIADEASITDIGHTKLDAWREIICEKHPNAKIVTHSTWAQYIFPVWEHWLNEWDVSYVTYTGTDLQRQRALDTFRDDPSIRVFLSGDSGSDSIDIPQASVGVNYNIPWKWTTLQQRVGRRHRVNSTFDTIYNYHLIMPDSVDERKLAVCNRKRKYHEALFGGHVTEEAVSASLSREDLIYLITGLVTETTDE